MDDHWVVGVVVAKVVAVDSELRSRLLHEQNHSNIRCKIESSDKKDLGILSFESLAIESDVKN